MTIAGRQIREAPVDVARQTAIRQVMGDAGIGFTADPPGLRLGDPASASSRALIPTGGGDARRRLRTIDRGETN